MRICPRCKQNKEITEFYKKRAKEGHSSYCKPCSTSQATDRQREFKRKAVEYKGGKCSRCGYCKCINALEFHHRIPSEKSFAISLARKTSFNQTILDELDKCDILCANCHREVEECP